MICSLVDGGHVADEAVVKLIPSADLDPMIKECEKLVNAIRRALPNSVQERESNLCEERQKQPISRASTYLPL
jgi:hypothetical protein